MSYGWWRRGCHRVFKASDEDWKDHLWGNWTKQMSKESLLAVLSSQFMLWRHSLTWFYSLIGCWWGSIENCCDQSIESMFAGKIWSIRYYETKMWLLEIVEVMIHEILAAYLLKLRWDRGNRLGICNPWQCRIFIEKQSVQPERTKGPRGGNLYFIFGNNTEFKARPEIN